MKVKLLVKSEDRDLISVIKQNVEEIVIITEKNQHTPNEQLDPKNTDLILLDLRVQRYEVLCEDLIGKNNKFISPVIIIDNNPEKKETAYKQGATDYLLEPISNIELVSKLRRQVNLLSQSIKTKSVLSKYNYLESVTCSGSYCLNVKGGSVEFTDGVKHLLGTDSNELNQKEFYQFLKSVVHKEDKYIIEKIESAIKSKVVSTELGYRITDYETGGIKYIKHFINTDKGHFVSGVMKDITEDVQSEEALKLMLELSDRFINDEDFINGLEYVMKRICKFMDWKVGHLFTSEAYCSALPASEIWHMEDGVKFDEFQTLTSKTQLDSKKMSLKKADKRKEALYIGNKKKDGLNGVYVLPILIENETACVLEFFVGSEINKDSFILKLLNEIGLRLGTLLNSKLMLDEIKENENLQKELIEKAAYPILKLNDEEVIIDINQEFLKALRYDTFQIIGNKIQSIIPDWDVKVSKYDLDGELSNAEMRSLKIGIEMEVLDSENQLIPYEISLSPLVKNGNIIIASFNDIRERKIKERQLEDSRERLNLAIETAKLGVWDWDLEHYKIVNEKFVSNANHELSEYFKRSTWREVIHPDDIEMVEENYEKAIDTLDELNLVYRILDDQDAIRHIQTKAKVISEKGKIATRIVGVNMDITDQEEAKTDLRQSNQELENFAYIASHDLQEPLRVIISYLQILESKYTNDLNERGKMYMERIIGAGNRMRKLIDALLEYSRIKSSNVSYKKIDLNQILQNVLDDSEVLLKENSAKVKINNLPIIVGNEDQIRRLFMNLINNSIKYRKPDVIPEIVVKSRKLKGNRVKITVTDNGIGIDEQYHDRVFDIFQRLHTREEYEGTGLGLAIIKKIVEGHGGKISINSRLNDGATFVINLPMI